MSARIRFYLDLLERSVWSFVQGFAGSMLIDGWLDRMALSTSEELMVGVGVGALAVAKCILSTQLPWSRSTTASSLPFQVEPR